ncbi:MAG: hypothetical protein IJU51_08625 [Clostridia bacterium]|nr:hypothetical protein [Clostridia bacterium]
MQFPHALKGVKKIFAAEIVMLIGQVLLVPLYIIVLLGVGGDELADVLEKRAPTYLWVLILLIIGAVGSYVISHIITIIGVLNASKDDNSFKISLLGIIVSIGTNIASFFLAENSMASAICSTTSQIANLAITFFIIQGIRSIAIKLEDDIMEIKGANIFKIYFILVLLAASTHFVSKAFNNDIAEMINVILIIISGILTVIQYILYLSYLKKARKMLET